MSDTLERVRKIVIDHLDADPEKVVEKASFIDDLGADSLDNVELVMAFEEEFDIEIPDDAAEHIQTVGDAVTDHDVVRRGPGDPDERAHRDTSRAVRISSATSAGSRPSVATLIVATDW